LARKGHRSLTSRSDRENAVALTLRPRRWTTMADKGGAYDQRIRRDEAEGRAQPYAYEPAPLGPFEVELQVTHCGICHSDIHLIDDDWGISAYPLCRGTKSSASSAPRGRPPNCRSARCRRRLAGGELPWACEWCVRATSRTVPMSAHVRRPGGRFCRGHPRRQAALHFPSPTG